MSERDTKREQFQEKPSSGKKFLAPVLVVVVAIVAVGGWFLFGNGTAGGPAVVEAGHDGKIRFAGKVSASLHTIAILN